MKISKVTWAVLLIVLVATLFFVELGGELTVQDAQVVSCESGLCSDSEATSGEGRAFSMDRMVAVGGASCSESVDAEAYLTSDHSYNKFYLHNRDVPSDSDLFTRDLGAHTGIYYELLQFDSSINKYFYTGETRRVDYAETDYFDVVPGQAYRINIYFCDTPLASVDCSDTDGGKYFGVKGVVTTSSGLYEDQCLADGMLLERYCDSDNTLDSARYDCSSEGTGYSCNEGS